MTEAKWQAVGVIVEAIGRDYDRRHEHIGTLVYNFSTGVDAFIRSSDPLWYLDALDALAQLFTWPAAQPQEPSRDDV